MSNVAIYVRVSTSKQDATNQLLQLREYCKKSNMDIYREYVDVISGKEESRPEYDELFRDAHKKLFDLVLFWSLDRFSRSGTLFTLQKLKELENLNIGWHSYQEPFVNTDNELTKNVVIALLSSIAKLERERISERTKAGLARAKAKGKKLGRKAIPDDVVEKVKVYLTSSERLPYTEISRLCTYKTKYGKVHHISPAQITLIKKGMKSNSDN